MSARSDPYPGSNYLVTVTSSIGVVSTLGGFQAVSGLAVGATSVTLKRGVVDSSVLVPWMNQVRTASASAVRTVLITLRGQSGQAVMSWQLAGATPASYIGPTLVGKVQTAAALQELILTVGNVQIVAPVTFVAVTGLRPIFKR